MHLCITNLVEVAILGFAVILLLTSIENRRPALNRSRSQEELTGRSK